MRRVTFLLGKDPRKVRGGDTRLSTLVMNAASASFDVRYLALGDVKEPVEVPFGTILPKGARFSFRTFSGTVRNRIHPIFARFDNQWLVNEIRSADSDLYVAEHSHMAQSLVKLKDIEPERICINTHVIESLIAQNSVQKRWLARAEFQVWSRASRIAAFDRAEITYLKDLDLRPSVNVTLLNLVLPPSTMSNLSGPLIFLGDRRWRPNQRAYESLLRLWPAIQRKVPSARLLVIGQRASARSVDRDLPEGVRDIGYVESLEDILLSASGLLAPIDIGGGVRVKILEACSRGIPVVTTSVGAGGLSAIFPALSVADHPQVFIDAASELASNRNRRVELGRSLWERNHELHAQRFLEEQVGRFLS